MSWYGFFFQMLSLHLIDSQIEYQRQTGQRPLEPIIPPVIPPPLIPQPVSPHRTGHLNKNNHIAAGSAPSPRAQMFHHPYANYGGEPNPYHYPPRAAWPAAAANHAGGLPTPPPSEPASPHIPTPLLIPGGYAVPWLVPIPWVVPVAWYPWPSPQPAPSRAPPTPPPEWPPKRRPNPVQLTPWLEWDEARSSYPPLVWDLRMQPETAMRVTARKTWESARDHFQEDAVRPAATKIMISCVRDIGGATFDWPPLLIEKTHSVTCYEVLSSIWEYFQQRFSDVEIEHMERQYPGIKRMISDSCHRRCMRTPGLAEFERRQGLRRVDYLDIRTMFKGLSVSVGLDGTWVLHLHLYGRHS